MLKHCKAWVVLSLILFWTYYQVLDMIWCHSMQCIAKEWVEVEGGEELQWGHPSASC